MAKTTAAARVGMRVSWAAGTDVIGGEIVHVAEDASHVIVASDGFVDRWASRGQAERTRRRRYDLTADGYRCAQGYGALRTRVEGPYEHARDALVVGCS